MLELALETCFMLLQCLGWRNHFHIHFHLEKQEKLGSLSARKSKEISRLILKQCQEETSLFIDRIVIIIFKKNIFWPNFLIEDKEGHWQSFVNMVIHTESAMLSCDFDKLVSCGCFEWKLTQSEGVSFLLSSQAVVPAGCNAQTAARLCCVMTFRWHTPESKDM